MATNKKDRSERFFLFAIIDAITSGSMIGWHFDSPGLGFGVFIGLLAIITAIGAMAELLR